MRGKRHELATPAKDNILLIKNISCHAVCDLYFESQNENVSSKKYVFFVFVIYLSKSTNQFPPLFLAEPLFDEKVGCLPWYRDGERLPRESGQKVHSFIQGLCLYFLHTPGVHFILLSPLCTHSGRMIPEDLEAKIVHAKSQVYALSFQLTFPSLFINYENEMLLINKETLN